MKYESIKVRFSGDGAETEKRMLEIARENGMGLFPSRTQFGAKWPKWTEPGVTVYEDFFHVEGCKLHVIIENDRKKLEADKMQRGLAINQD